MSIKRWGAARDHNERAIVDALLKAGALVYRLDEPCDLLVGFGGATWLLEVKVPGGKLTPKQERFMSEWSKAGGSCVVVRTVTEALQAIGASDLDVEIGPRRPAAQFPAWPSCGPTNGEGAD